LAFFVASLLSGQLRFQWRCYGAGGEEMAPSSLDQ
jgi:hypothetical protein